MPPLSRRAGLFAPWLLPPLEVKPDAATGVSFSTVIPAWLRIQNSGDSSFRGRQEGALTKPLDSRLRGHDALLLYDVKTMSKNKL